MKIFLIIYCILALLSFVAFYAMTDAVVRDRNDLYTIDVYKVSFPKILLMAAFFPLAWIGAVIHAIGAMKE